MSSHLSHHPQEVLLAQFSLYVHKSGLKLALFFYFYLCFGYEAIKFFLKDFQSEFDVHTRQLLTPQDGHHAGTNEMNRALGHLCAHIG